MSGSKRALDDEQLMTAARAELERDAQALDVLTVARLRVARTRALEQASRPSSSWAASWGLPAGAFATAVLLSLSLWLTQRQPAPAVDGTPVEILAADEATDLYENLDFYEWLEIQ
ncbi:MAG: hypothetical protein ACRESW_08665, partial [Nevskiales bacterium]